ncbi:hypothetical protein SAMN04489712_111245 [Thermomonospora echinospora]|uniref:Uncharacterized protein n=1 Tax=Thermomonospora echinospora TaxID=1992 RepID=A0A1H6CW41_9ACTN|nr:hypothetical protein [Thermomonospora echinospora]SEG77078.1 hypothetical protein SAMN04489712_111245 [Thermomonospora echinospora]
MLAQREIAGIGVGTDAADIGALMVEPETAISDAPVFTPNGALLLLAAVLLSPKGPKSR